MKSAPRRSAEAALAALALGLSPGAAPAQAVIGAQVTQLVQGLYCAPPEGARRDAPGTLFGWIHAPGAPVQMVAEGTVAPMVLGMGFGVRFALAGQGPVTLTHEVQHPPMTERGVTSQSWQSQGFRGETESVFFQFDLPEEMVPGAWTFTARADGEVLFHAPFTVVPEAQAPELANLCRDGLLFSAL